MSTNYKDRCLLASGKVTTPTNGDVQNHIFGVNQPFCVQSLRIYVVTAGAQAATECRLETIGGASIATKVIGTAAADSVFEVKVAEASREQAATAKLRVKAITTDASAVYRYEVWGTYPDV